MLGDYGAVLSAPLGEAGATAQIVGVVLVGVGFALETNDEQEHARAKLKKKNLDFIVLNSLRDPGAGFACDTNKVTMLFADGKTLDFPLKDKREVANDLTEQLCALF